MATLPDSRTDRLRRPTAAGLSVRPGPRLSAGGLARARRGLALAFALLLFSGPARAAAQTDDVLPADFASILLLRVLAYDRMLPERCGNHLVIGIVYNPAGPASVQWKDRLARALSEVGPRLPVRKMPAVVVSLPFSGAESFAASLREHAVSVAVLGPDLGAHISQITQVTHLHRTLSVGVVRGYLTNGASLGLLVGAGRKAKVLVNVAASKAEGVEFEAGLLRLAELL